MAKFLTYVAVYAVLEKSGRVLLLRRANTGYRDGQYSLPAGHVEEGETPVLAMRREGREEIGVDLDVTEKNMAHALYRMNPDRTYTDYFFVCRDWQGEPRNMEADKCDELLWADINALPENVVPEVKQALHCIVASEKFSQLDLRKEEYRDRPN